MPVIDDELRAQEAMRRTLDEDFRIPTANDAAEARRLMDRLPALRRGT